MEPEVVRHKKRKEARNCHVVFVNRLGVSEIITQPPQHFEMGFPGKRTASVAWRYITVFYDSFETQVGVYTASDVINDLDSCEYLESGNCQYPNEIFKIEKYIDFANFVSLYLKFGIGN